MPAKQQMREEQRTNILEAARRVFARKGLIATMDEVAAEAAVSHGLAYRYFASKEAIVRALIEEALQAPSAEPHPLQDVPGTPGERLDFLISAWLESRRTHPEFFQLLDQVLHDEAMPSDFREIVSRRRQALRDLLRHLIVEGQKTGEVAADDPDQLVRAILACFDGLTRWGTHDPAHDHEHFPETSIVLRMLKPE